MRNQARRTFVLVLALTGLAFALRVYHLDYQSLWRDEVDALRFATRPWPELLAMFTKPGENGPLFFLTLRAWLAVAGHSEFALRFPAVWAGTLAVPVTYSLIRRLAAAEGRAQDARAGGLVGAALMATGPYLVWYGQDAKMYALLTVLVPLTLLLATALAQRGGVWRWVALYGLTSASFYTHLLAALVVPVQVLWLLMLPAGPRAEVRRRRVEAGAYVAALVLPYLPLAAWQFQALFAPPPERLGQPVMSLGAIGQVLALGFSQGILGRSRPAAMPALFALLAGVLLWPWPRPKPAAPPLALVAANEESSGAGARARAWMHGEAPALRTVLPLVCWLALPPIEIYLISLHIPLFLDRYLIWVMPAFVGLTAYGIVALRRVGRPWGLAVLGAVIALNLAAVGAQASTPIKSDFRGAARFVMERRQAGDVLVFQIPYNQYSFSYYAGEEFAWLDGPFTNRGESESFVADWMARGTLGRRGVWLIECEAPLWDERGLAARWLARQGRITDQADFARVRVTRYNLQQ